ncbi:hypothetical protein [Nitrosospira briensis]|uniref:hypothetical protein n=1 Tax=Nitrosospira briensis TaxID=35799 RepID=UPI00046AAE43|nr:hypothetical protein [Nitrosospira briensis]
MKMNLSKIAVAVAALGAAQAAFALTPAQVNAGPTTYVWLSGASAPTNAVFRSVMALCNGLAGNGGANDAHMYLEGAGTEPGKSSGDRVAYACTMSSAAGSLAGKKVVVYHTVEGGSFNAYAPHLSMAGEPNPHGYLPGNLKRVNDLKSLGAGGKCAAGTPAITNVTLNGVAYPIGRYNNCSDTITKTFTASLKGDAAGKPGESYPDGGFSDTEYLINRQNLDIGLDLGAIGGEVATNVGQAFGVAVSYPLYHQLQKNDVASGILASTCDDGSPTAPVLTPASCQPSLPAQRYSAIANRDTVGSADGSLFGGPAGSIVNLVRRVPTSGTQSASNMRFLAKPCSTGLSGGSLEPARATGSTPTVVITEQSSTGGVKSALNTATGAGQFALGVVSAENTPAPTATADRWAFVKLDRVSPNSDAQQRAEAMDGSYSFWYELAAFTAGGSVSPASAAGTDLIAAAAATLGESDLKGIFATPAAGSSGPTSKGARLGNSCQPAIQ